MEFDEFLKIKGCKEGSHLFVGNQVVETKKVVNEVFECRHDWYQSPTHVTISLYAKKVAPENAIIVFEDQKVNEMIVWQHFLTVLALSQSYPAGWYPLQIGTRSLPAH
jgi:hypothetical protein